MDLALHQEKHQIENKYLKVLSEVNGSLIHYHNWYEAIDKCFGLIADVLLVDRAYYFENHFDAEQTPVVTQRLEWIRGNVLAQINNPELQNLPHTIIQPLIDSNLEGEAYQVIVSQMEAGDFQSILADQDVKSLVSMPIFVSKKFWGFLGFDDCHLERIWESDELEFLKNITSSIASAIEAYESERALEKAYEEKNSILESIADGFIALDVYWNITYWNNKAASLLNKSKADVLHKNFRKLFVFPKDVEKKFEEARLKAIEENKPYQFEFKIDGLESWYEVNTYPAPQGVSIFFKEVTERKQQERLLNESKERLEMVNEATKDAIWDWDLITDSFFRGKGFLELFGYDIHKESHLFSTWSHLIHPDDIDEVVKSLFEILNDSSKNHWEKEYRYMKSNGQWSQIKDRGVVSRDERGEAVRIVGAMTDITEQVEYENSLNRLNLDLEERARQLETSNQELEQFAYVASHDLQEPLRMISSFLHQLEKKYDHVLDEKAKKYIHYAVDGSNRMKQIILDLLEYSRVGKEVNETVHVDVNRILDDVISLNRRLIEEKGAVVNRVANFPVFIGCKSPLLRIFQNLIENALKFSDQNRQQQIDITWEELSDHWRFSIKDNGIGISEEFHDKIFNIFQRLHSRESFAGNGMGLAIVKKLIENLGGSIWVNSIEGKGSEFIFTLHKNVCKHYRENSTEQYLKATPTPLFK